MKISILFLGFIFCLNTPCQLIVKCKVELAENGSYYVKKPIELGEIDTCRLVVDRCSIFDENIKFSIHFENLNKEHIKLDKLSIIKVKSSKKKIIILDTLQVLESENLTFESTFKKREFLVISNEKLGDKMYDFR